MWCLINVVCAQTLARVLFPSSSGPFDPPVDSPQLSSSHLFNPSVDSPQPSCCQGPSTLVTCYLQGTPLSRRKCTTLSSSPSGKEDGTPSNGTFTPCSQELFDSPSIVTAIATGEDARDPSDDAAGTVNNYCVAYHIYPTSVSERYSIALPHSLL